MAETPPSLQSSSSDHLGLRSGQVLHVLALSSHHWYLPNKRFHVGPSPGLTKRTVRNDLTQIWPEADEGFHESYLAIWQQVTMPWPHQSAQSPGHMMTPPVWSSVAQSQWTDREKDRSTDGRTDTQTHRHRHRHTHTCARVHAHSCQWELSWTQQESRTLKNINCAEEHQPRISRENKNVFSLPLLLKEEHRLHFNFQGKHRNLSLYRVPKCEGNHFKRSLAALFSLWNTWTTVAQIRTWSFKNIAQLHRFCLLSSPAWVRPTDVVGVDLRLHCTGPRFRQTDACSHKRHFHTSAHPGIGRLDDYTSTQTLHPMML